MGIVEIPVPILKGNARLIKEIRERLYEAEFQDLLAIDFSDVAQGCNAYDDFIDKLSETPESELQYLGIALCGSKKNSKQANRQYSAFAVRYNMALNFVG